MVNVLEPMIQSGQVKWFYVCGQTGHPNLKWCTSRKRHNNSL